MRYKEVTQTKQTNHSLILQNDAGVKWVFATDPEGDNLTYSLDALSISRGMNLHPIAGLERELRRRMGDPALIWRGLRLAAAAGG